MTIPMTAGDTLLGFGATQHARDRGWTTLVLPPYWAVTLAFNIATASLLGSAAIVAYRQGYADGVAEEFCGSAPSFGTHFPDPDGSDHPFLPAYPAKNQTALTR